MGPATTDRGLACVAALTGTGVRPVARLAADGGLGQHQILGVPLKKAAVETVAHAVRKGEGDERPRQFRCRERVDE